MTERVVRLIGRDIGFAAPVAFSGEQVPGALGLGQLAAAAELPEVQVRLGYPAPPFGPPAGEGSSDCPVLPPLSASARRIPAEYRDDHDQPDPLAERDDLEGTRARSPMFGNAGG